MSWVLAYLLVVGHLASDFLFQSKSLLARKHTLAGLLQHGAILAFISFLALLPYVSGELFWIICAIFATHLGIDFAKVQLQRKFGKNIGFFLADQALHFGVLALVYLRGNLQETDFFVTSEEYAYAVTMFCAGVILARILRLKRRRAPRAS